MTQPQRRPASSSPDPVLITDAARSYEEELRVRKRRYALMMGMRVPCMVLAAVFYQTPWLAVTPWSSRSRCPGWPYSSRTTGCPARARRCTATSRSPRAGGPHAGS